MEKRQIFTYSETRRLLGVADVGLNKLLATPDHKLRKLATPEGRTLFTKASVYAQRGIPNAWLVAAPLELDDLLTMSEIGPLLGCGPDYVKELVPAMGLQWLSAGHANYLTMGQLQELLGHYPVDWDDVPTLTELSISRGPNRLTLENEVIALMVRVDELETTVAELKRYTEAKYSTLGTQLTTVEQKLTPQPAILRRE